jgi:2-amino-4-hydroxy-6-hydroxymethyldihydropteridine diphosphokinase
VQAHLLLEIYCGKIIHKSTYYETAPWGYLDQPAFLNQALALQTALSPTELMTILLSIEEKMGRVRIIKSGPRIIDLDILLIGSNIINTPALTVPHPALPDRRFALIPMAEIAPLLVHPILKKTIQELLVECSDDSDVQKKII